jgi:DNA-binding transcriptional ArsR family regulator
LDRLTEGSATVGQLADPVDLTVAAVSKHLQVLERAGLVSRTRDRRFRPAALDARPLAGAVRWLRVYDVFLRESLDSLENQLAEPGRNPGGPSKETRKKEEGRHDQ